MQRPEAIFLDGPAGTQVAARRRCDDPLLHTLQRQPRRRLCDQHRVRPRILDDAHAAAADLLNAPSADEIIFGNNTTRRSRSTRGRSIAKILKPGDEVMVTRLDHDANVSPWTLAARDAGATVRSVDIGKDDCTLNLDSFRKQLSKKTSGSRSASHPTASARSTTSPRSRRKRSVPARPCFLMPSTMPRGPIDVQTLGCDFLACSAYKFFGPHVGILWEPP